MWTTVLLASIVMISLPTFSLCDEEDEEEWQCGADTVGRFLSESQIELDCPRLKKRINQCCIQHDDCYTAQLGRKYCDDKFCRCLTVVTQGSGVCASEDGPLFCHLVREFGELPYLRSAPNATITQTPISLAIQAVHADSALITHFHKMTMLGCSFLSFDLPVWYFIPIWLQKYLCDLCLCSGKEFVHDFVLDLRIKEIGQRTEFSVMRMGIVV
uniref:GDNF domain-containing protein n=1 Tax=Angiostrongylus cantonensis TaxID=6313 RepID=A0A0K0D3J9_ANGCA